MKEQEDVSFEYYVSESTYGSLSDQMFVKDHDYVPVPVSVSCPENMICLYPMEIPYDPNGKK